VAAGLLVQTKAALDALAADGAITTDQAAAIQGRVAAGSVDENEVVRSGVLDDAQMERVASALTAIKLGAASP
jgi:hypothetical protein